MGTNDDTDAPEAGAIPDNDSPAQRQYASSENQIQSLDARLLDTFSSNTSDGQDDQICAAIALIQMPVRSVIQIVTSFGGDNPTDVGLSSETTQFAVKDFLILRLSPELGA